MKTQDESTVFIGIDPGTTGAICRLWGTETHVWAHPKGYEDMLCLWNSILPAKRTYRTVICLEDVIGICGGAAVAKKIAFQLGAVTGFWMALIINGGYEYKLAKPREWQDAVWGRKKFSTSKERKTFSRDEAIRVFPGLRDGLMRVKDHDKADAIHLARYVREIWR